MRSHFKYAFLFAVLTFLSAGLGFSQTAVSLPLDSSAAGSWVGTYGQDGFLIANDALSSLPGYVSGVSATAPTYTWAASTTDTRGLYTTVSKSDRIESTYYSTSTFLFDVNTTGGSHQIAVYCLDLETSQRAQTISITDTDGNVLNNSTQTLSNFHNGVYARWNISGHVLVKITYTGGLNAVVSGLFFSPAVSLGPPPTVTFTNPTAASGTLSGTIPVTAAASSAPGISSVQFAVDGKNIGSPVPPPASGSTYSTSWATSSVASGTHSLTATAADVLGQTTTATLSVNTFNAGPPPAGATFFKTDTATKGNWVGTYGQNGALIANDPSAILPAYAIVNTPAPQYTWSASSTDVRALYTSGAGNSRIASTYYSDSSSGASFTFDVNLSDGNAHQVALYAYDFENFGRAETIKILDATSSAVLDTRSIASFGNGIYEVWNLTGHVLIQVINSGNSSAVISGLFFGLPPSPPPTATITVPAGGTTVSGNAVTVTATAAASSPATVSSVQFQLDGVNIGTAVSAAPYSILWDSTTAGNGSHTLTAIATDSVGQHGTSAGVIITTSNAGPPAPTVSITAPSAGATVAGATTVTATVGSSAMPVSVQFQLDGVNLGSAVNAAPYSISWDTSAATNTGHSLTAIATDNLHQSTTSAAVPVTVFNVGPPPPAATFVKTDITTKGNWVGTYGQNGALIANDGSVALPPYASVTTAAPQYTWLASTTDVRALYTSSAASSRMASTYYSAGNSGASFTLDVNLTDGNAHQVALYSLDLENAGRSQTISILKASDGSVLDTRSLSGFGGGAYLVWNLTGHVIISVSNGGGLNAVVSGLFFGLPPSPPPTAVITAPIGGTTVTGNAVTLTATAGATLPATVSSVQFQLDGVNLGAPVNSSPYTISWDTTTAGNGSHILTAVVTDSAGQRGTSAGVAVTTSNAGPAAPTVSITSPAGGATVTGTTTVTATAGSSAMPVSVQFQLDGANLGAPVNAVPYSISWNTAAAGNTGHSLTAIATDNLHQSTTSAAVSVTVFNAGPPPAAATFVKTDTATKGNWAGAYGQNGALIANDSSVALPGYATVNTAAARYTWVGSTTDARALYTSTTANDRIASTYYSGNDAGSSFTFDVNLIDGNSHQVALYALDFETFGRAETIKILDAVSNAVLDTRSIAGFGNGVYQVWNITGHVLIKVINSGSSSGVISGLFFGPPPSPPPTAAITAPSGGTTVTGNAVTVTATAAAASPATVSSVQFQLDGANIGSAVSSSPYSISWDSTTVGNGSHVLTAIATDSAGQRGTSPGVTVTTSNAGPPAPTVSITAPSAGASVAGATTVTATVGSSAMPVSVQFQLDGANLGAAVTAAPYSISWDTTTTGNTGHSLTAIATDNLHQSTTSSAVSVTVFNVGPPPPSATFVKSDTLTKGNWVGTYGQNGAVIANDPSVTLPSYATVTTAAPPYTWVASTTDARALYTSTAASSRMASTYYSAANIGASFTFDVNLTDGSSHQVAVYSLDFEGFGRAQSIKILNANNNAVLDTRSVANFSNGVYEVWNLTGHVLIQVVNSGNSSAVVSGLLFGPGSASGPPPTITITSPTAGASLTGAANLTATTVSTPGVANVQFLVDGIAIGSAVTSANSTFATTWTTNSVSNGTHTLTAVATDNLNQSTTSAGVSVSISNSGPPPASATFVKADTTTIGNWKGAYGGDGYVIPNDSTILPPYGTVTAPASPYTWLPTTNDPRALVKGVSLTDRIASTYVTASSMTFDINLTDGLNHQFALYLLDLDTSERAETILIKDFSSGTTLSTRNVSNFHGGVYEVWNINGHITITVQYTGGLNAVVAGVFFGTGAVPPAVSITAPAAGPVSGTVTLTANATSSVGIASVQFQSDGANVGAAVTGTGPNFSTSWDTIVNSSIGSHAITAIATDKLGQTTTSAAVSVSVSNSGAHPVISITAPTAGTITGTISVTANATGALGVKTVQFQVDGANLGAAVTGAGPLFSAQWNTSTANNGSHTLAAIATDYIGQTTSTSISVNVANGPAPIVTLSTPANGASVQGAVPLSATATSTLGAVSVQFKIDGVNLGAPVTGAGPFTSTWDSTKGPNGAHTVSAVAIDVLNQTSTSTNTVTAANPAPVINISSPSAGLVFGTQAVTANVTSSVGIASVQFKLDGADLGSAVTAAPFTMSWDTTAAANGSHTLSAIATDILGQTTTAAPVAVTVARAAASFVSFDTTTRGGWIDVYGQEGAVIPNDLTTPPAYVTLGFNNGTSFTYSPSTTDARALLKSTTSSDRIASDFIPAAGSTFDIDLAFSDQAMHRLVLYFLDFAGTAPNQTVSILDANGNSVLDTQDIANAAFQSGEYGLWNVSGHVLVRVTSTNGLSPLVSGIFFQTAPAVSITAPAAGPVSGNVTITASATSLVGVSSVQFKVDGVNLGAAIGGAGPLYSTSWDSVPVSSGSHVLTAIATDANGLIGTSAPVVVTVANSGSLLPGATFVKLDTTTSGNWIGVYGQEGEYVVGETNNAPPSYVKTQNLNMIGGTPYTWIDTQPADSHDPRGLQAIPPGTGSFGAGRNPSAWYSATNMSIRVSITDGLAHQLGLYCVDFDSFLRTEDIEILDANTNAVLDKRSLANFHNGVYLVWNITGDIIIRATYTGPSGQAYSNAVVSGLFFRTFAGSPAPQVALTSPATGSVLGSINLAATATSAVGLASVRFQLDGSDLLATVPVPGPYTEPWVTTTTPNGAHTLTAIATDTLGQTTVSSPVAITIANGAAPAPAATFAGTDTTTSGSWTTTYGTDGFLIPNDAASIPAYYATVNLNGANLFTYADPTNFPEGLLKSRTSTTTDRIVSAYYQPTDGVNNNGVVLIDVNLIDFQQHQVALYFVDWQASTRNVKILILNSTTQAVLDTQTVANYPSGKYLIWNLTGHVTIKITEIINDPASAPNSVTVNGIFFDPLH